MPSPPTGSSGRLATLLADRRVVLAVLGVIIAAFLTFGVVWAFANPQAFVKPAGDGAYYEVMVKQWLTRGVYAYKSDLPNARVTPGYPLLLAGVYLATGRANRPAGSWGGPYRAIYWLQLLFAAGSIALTYLIGSELFGRGPGLTAALLIALYPPMQQSAAKMLTEPLGLVLFLGYVYVQLLALRRDDRLLWLATGVLFGATLMVRPSFALVGVVPLVYVLVTKRDWRHLLVQAGLLAAGFALIVSPWVVRNIVALHQPVVLAAGIDDPILAGVDPYHFEKGSIYRYRGPSYDAWMVNHGITLGPYPPGFEVSGGEYAWRVILAKLQTEPARLIEWFTIGKVRSMFTRLWEGGDESMATLTWVVQIAIVGLGTLGMVLSFKDERFRLLTFMILVGVASLLPYVPEPRYVFGFMPLLAVLAAATMQRAWTASSQNGSSQPA